MPQTRHYEMKDSGVEWIGRMPRHWRIERAKFHFRQSFERGNSTPELLAATQKHGMYPQRLLEGVVQVMAGTDLQQFKSVHINDFVISLRSFQGGFERSDYEGVCSPAYQVFHADKQYDVKWLKWFFKNDMFIDAMNALTVGIREGRNIKFDDFANSLLPVPPLSEQTAIAAYLDEKCATIDAIIAEAKSSIEEYKSWKASVIFETVTKGLNPNAEMKDSGVEWIGEIPKGWKVSAVKRHYSIILGKMLESVPQSNDATLENYMCASNVKWGGIDTTTNRQMWFSPIEKEEYLLKEGDLLVMEGGSAGTSAIYRGEYAPCYMQNSVNRCRSKDGSLTHFLYYWMFLVYHSGHVESACNRATIMHLTKEKLGRLPFVYAPKEEQASIVSYLDRKCSLIDGIIAEKEDLIRELENYKRSLIFEVVTGKRRVC